jgi:hypothetical protein
MKSKLNYDRQSVGQSVLVSGPHLEPMTRFFFFFSLTMAGLLLWGTLSDERMSLSFTPTIASGHCQISHSRVQVSQNSDHMLLSHLRLPQSGGPGSPVFISPKKQGGPVISPCTGFPFRRLLRLTGLWWRYSNPKSKSCYDCQSVSHILTLYKHLTPG